MKQLIALLLAIMPFGLWSQWLPVWSSTATHCPPCADSLDGRYAEMYFDTWWYWGREIRTVSRLYFTTDTIYPWESYTLYIHMKLPPDADFQVSMRTDSTINSILYDWKARGKDNNYTEPRIDTVLTIDVPPYSIFHYGRPFAQFGLLFNQRNWPFDPPLSMLSPLVDAVFLERHPEDTIVIPRDTLPQDTVTVGDSLTLSVRHRGALRRLLPPVEPYDIRGAKADTLAAPWWIEHDTAVGIKRIRIRK